MSIIPTGFDISQFDAESDIPVMPCEAKPGEVLYLGMLYIDGIGHTAQVSSKSSSITYNVINEREKILMEPNKKYP